MEKEQPKWKRISKGEKLPCWAFLMMMDGTITNVTAMGVTIKQDAYYLPSYGLIDTIKDFPKEESKDERIRKTLIAVVNLYYGEGEDEEKTACLYWLEKQGEQKPANWLQELEDKLANATPEQLAEWKEKYFKEDPAWSEEDEKILSDIIKDLVHTWNEYIPDRIEDEIKWLKTKFKSLRPQSTWKPSEEQIRVVARLRHCLLEDVRGNDVVILDNLLEQLKELSL